MNNPSPRLENHIIGPKKLFEEQRYLGEYRCSCGKTFFDNVQGAIAHLNDFAAKQQEGKPMNDDCAFCKKIAAEQLGGAVVSFQPLNPVTKGHWLVVPTRHVQDAAEDPSLTAKVMKVAAKIASNYPDVNIITSKGAHATQTVFHLHLHVIPRRRGDGLALPWSQNQ